MTKTSEATAATTLNLIRVASTNLVHLTSAEVRGDYQSETNTLCSRRIVWGYVRPADTQTVTCPRCIAKS